MALLAAASALQCASADIAAGSGEGLAASQGRRQGALESRLDPSSRPWVTHEPTVCQNSTTEREAKACWDLGRKCGPVRSDSGVLPWRPEELGRSLVVPALEQYGPLINKLHMGQPIRVFAYGSSITHWQAGCFHTGPASQIAQRLGARGPPSWSVLYKEFDFQQHHLAACHYAEGWTPGVGWVNAFMQVINASFPHPEHAFINAGRTATKLGDFADMGCLDEHLPSSIDLLILENPAALSGGAKVEQLLWRVLQHYATRQEYRPAVLMINGAYVTHNFSQPEISCMRNSSLCDTQCVDFRHAMSGGNFYTPHDGELAALAQYYGITLVSHRHFLYQALQDDVPAKHNTSVCHYMSALYYDHVHLGTLGHTLFTHYMLNVLHEAEQLYLSSSSSSSLATATTATSTDVTSTSALTTTTTATPDATTSASSLFVRRSARSTSASSATSSTATSTATAPGATAARQAVSQRRTLEAGAEAPLLLPPVLPPEELFPKSWELRDTRCPVLVDVHNVSSTDDHAQALRNGSAALIVENQGWRFVEYQVNGEGRHYRYKPGFVADSPGSKLRLRLNTVMSKPQTATSSASSTTTAGTKGARDYPWDHGPKAAGRQGLRHMPNPKMQGGAGGGAKATSLVVSYLTSYEHMGTARISCVEGCKCKEAVVDAHALERVSLYKTEILAVSPSWACDVEVEVLPATSSGEHKWKLIGLTVSVSAQTWSPDTDADMLAP